MDVMNGSLHVESPLPYSPINCGCGRLQPFMRPIDSAKIIDSFKLSIMRLFCRYSELCAM